MRRIKSLIRPEVTALAALLILCAVLYGPSIGFGFLWDDPLWFGQVLGKSFWELIGPTPTFQFYRPGTMVLNRLFMRRDGTFDPVPMHLFQVALHLGNVLLTYLLGLRLSGSMEPFGREDVPRSSDKALRAEGPAGAPAQGLSSGQGRRVALAAALLFALYPPSYQAVAWAAPQQPIVTFCLLGSMLAYVEAWQRWPTAVWLAVGLFFVALTIQESAVLFAAMPLILELCRQRRRPLAQYSTRPLWFMLLAGLFVVIWALMPRRPGFVQVGFQVPVGLYLLQGLAFPLLGHPLGWPAILAKAPLVGLTSLIAAVALAAALIRSGRGQVAVVGFGWFVAAVLPAWAGLAYPYVQVSPRLLYPGAFGVALLWSAALQPPAGSGSVQPGWHVAGLVFIAAIGLQSGLLVMSFNRLYRVGTAHLAEMVHVLETAGNDARLLFINFPDRYAPRRAPYPLGYWGLTLAPVAVDLGGYGALEKGVRPATRSLSVPAVGFAERRAGPYVVDMRGVIVGVKELYTEVRQADRVYLSQYRADGTLRLRYAGAIRAEASAGDARATFGDVVQLINAEAHVAADGIVVDLTWRSLAPAERDDTVFLHLAQPGQPPVAQADGDALLGLVPLRAWQPGDTIHEQRVIPLPAGTGLAGEYEVKVGLYNRRTGVRLAARTPGGTPLWENGLVIARIQFSRRPAKNLPIASLDRGSSTGCMPMRATVSLL